MTIAVPVNRRTPKIRLRSRPRHWLRLGCAVALILAAGGCQLIDMAKFSYANASSRHTWLNDSQRTVVPFTLVDNHIIVPLSINGSEPLNFVLDSGAAATVIIESRHTRTLPLTLGAGLVVSGVGTGPHPVAHIVAETDLSLGDVRLEGQSVIYIALDSIPFFDDLDDVYFDGALGYEFFRRFRVEIDYERRLVSFSEPASDDLALHGAGMEWQELPLQIRAAMPYVEAQVKAGEGEPTGVRLLVDTGYRGALSLTPSTHDALADPGEYFSTVSQGLSGDVHNRVAMSEYLAVGPYRLGSLPVSYAVSGGESASGSNGILGNDVLSRFHLVFDYPGERLLLAPNGWFGMPIAADRSGLLIRPHAAGGVVKRIAPGSAGEKAGLNVGDIITHYDDRPVTPETITGLKRALASERGPLPLCWLSGAQAYCAELALASRFGESAG